MHTTTEERMALREQAPDRASTLIGTIAACVSTIHDPRDRLANQVGRLQGELRQICAELEEAQDALREALEFIEGCEDVVDGSYGEPRPNRAMQVAQTLRGLVGEV